MGPAQHAEGHAGFHAQRLDALHHIDDGVHVAVLRAAPGGPHAKPACAAVLCLTRLRHDRIDVHQFFGIDAGLEMRRLRTIFAVFRTAAGLDREQTAFLDAVGIEVMAMDRLRAKQQVVEGQVEKRPDFRLRPVVANPAGVGQRRGAGGPCHSGFGSRLRITLGSRDSSIGRSGAILRNGPATKDPDARIIFERGCKVKRTKRRRHSHRLGR